MNINDHDDREKIIEELRGKRQELLRRIAIEKRENSYNDK